MRKRPKILSIAGFDPSGGAGVLADIKTFEQHKCQGFAVCTANTIQNESEFISPNWVERGVILDQLNTLLKQHHFVWIKVGLIKDFEFLIELTELANLTQSKIIWDPVLSTSSSFDFKHDLSSLRKVLSRVFLITPNWNEVKILSGKEDALKGAEELAKYTKVYLKGGHNSSSPGKDYLFDQGIIKPLAPKTTNATEKHGSGCIFSSALTANLSLGFSLHKACLKSKQYISRVLESNDGLLGYHHR